MCQIFFYVRTINCRNKTIQSTIGILCLCVYNQNQNKNTIVIQKKRIQTTGNQIADTLTINQVTETNSK